VLNFVKHYKTKSFLNTLAIFIVVIKTDGMRGQCLGLAVMTVKGKENTEI